MVRISFNTMPQGFWLRPPKLLATLGTGAILFWKRARATV